MRRHALLSAAALCAAITSVSFAACGKTPGAPATISVVVGGTTGTYDDALGWHIVLDDAHVAFGPVYVYAPEGDTTASLLRALLPVARAHGGHDPLSGRAVRVEWLDQAAVDLLAVPVTVGEATGTAGACDGMEFLLDPPDAANVGPVHGHHFWISGVATKGTETVPFEGGFDIPMTSAISRVVEGVPLSTMISTGGTLTIDVKLEQWLDQADFTGLTAPTGGRVELTSDTQPYIAWYAGARSAAAFTAGYAPAPMVTP